MNRFLKIVGLFPVSSLCTTDARFPLVSFIRVYVDDLEINLNCAVGVILFITLTLYDEVIWKTTK